MALPLVNGINYSWVNLNNIVLGNLVRGIKNITYERKQEKVNNYGWGSEPISRGYGNITYEGKITVYKDWYQSFINASPGKDPLAVGPFDWVISFANGAVTPFNETLKSVEFMSDNLNANQGDTSLTIDIPFTFAGLVRN